MGGCCCCCCPKPAPDDLQNEVDKQSRIIEGDIDEEIKLLLLGTGESGKSTFIKQMRIIHGDGYKNNDKLNFIAIVAQNVLDSMQTMIKAMSDLNISYQNKENIENAEKIQEINYHVITKLENKHEILLKSLWDDAGIQECFKRSNEYQLLDSTKYFLQNLSRICKPNYVPTEDDIVRTRVKTTGIVEYPFKVEKNQFRIVDVGGQRNLREKWIKGVDDVSTVIYLTAISEYDQKLREDPNRNRLQESVDLFKVLVNSDILKKASFILFLNKVDLFDEKIMHSDLADHFPEYKGPKKNAQKAKDFIFHMFLNAVSQTADKEKTIFSHYTCATDTNNIKIIFTSVKSVAIQSYIEMVCSC